MVTKLLSCEYNNTDYNFFNMKRLPFFVALIFIGLFLNAQKSAVSTFFEQWNSETANASSYEKTHFRSNESITPEIGSWMNSAHFYFFDDQSGHLIIKTNDKSFVHKNVPVAVWNSMKVAKSVGKYYNIYVKHKYKMTNRDSILAIL